MLLPRRTSKPTVPLSFRRIIHGNSVRQENTLGKTGAFCQLHRLSFVGIVGKLYENMPLVIGVSVIAIDDTHSII